MNANLLVSDQQRDRAVNQLQAAYANGALDEVEFDRRLDSALGARDRAELNRALMGLPRVSPIHPVAQPLRRPGQPTSAENLGAGLTHLSGMFSWVVGPALVKAVATPGSRVWWEASRALSFQLTAALAALAALGVAVVLGFGELLFLGWAAWFFGTIISSVRAFNGKSGTGAVDRFLVMREEPRLGALPPRR